MIRNISKSTWLKVCVVSIVLVGIVLVLVTIQNKDMTSVKEDEEKVDSFSLIEEEIEIEYGNMLSMNPIDYVQDSVGVIDIENIQVDLYRVFDISNATEKIDVFDEKLEVGTYYLVFTYELEKKEMLVRVVDTQFPVLVLKHKEVALDVGSKFNANLYVEKSEDVVDGKLEYVVNNDVDIHASGEYTITYVVKDKNGNESKEDLKVIVKGKKKDSNKKSEEVVKVENKEELDDGNPNNDCDSDIDDPKASMDSQVKESNQELVPWTPEEVPSNLIGDGKVAFSTSSEPHAWAKKQIEDENSEWYGVVNYHCIQVKKHGQQKLPNDPWVVYFFR